jgi:hypothetical protein
MEPTACGSTGTGDVAAVLRDLRFYQNNIKHTENQHSFLRTNIIVILYLFEFNYKMQQKVKKSAKNAEKNIGGRV